MPGTPAYLLYRTIWAGLDWLYPPHCGGCGRAGMRWCPDCQAVTHIITPPVCQVCGKQVGQVGLCRLCRMAPPRYTALRSWAIFGGPIRDAIHRLKYQGDIALGETLARPLIECLVEVNWAVDLVIPVPPGQIRKAERGYNQAALLAHPVALACRLQYRPEALTRNRETRTQVGLSADERKLNVANAFQARSNTTAGKNILIVDDVATSGATLEACAEALFSAGARKVYALTLTRAA